MKKNFIAKFLLAALLFTSTSNIVFAETNEAYQESNNNIIQYDTNDESNPSSKDHIIDLREESGQALLSEFIKWCDKKPDNYMIKDWDGGFGYGIYHNTIAIIDKSIEPSQIPGNNDHLLAYVHIIIKIDTGLTVDEWSEVYSAEAKGLVTVNKSKNPVDNKDIVIIRETNNNLTRNADLGVWIIEDTVIEKPVEPELPVVPEVPVEPEIPTEPESPSVPELPITPEVPESTTDDITSNNTTIDTSNKEELPYTGGTNSIIILTCGAMLVVAGKKFIN